MNKFAFIWLLSIGIVQAEEIFTNEFEALVATRQNSLILKDPHLFQESLGCTDYTNFLNDILIPGQFTADTDGDSFLDLNNLLQFNTDQPDYLVNKNLKVNLIDGNCPDPLFSGPCVTNTVIESDIATTFDLNNTCLEPIAATTSGYTDAVINSDSPCFVTTPIDFTLSISGINIPLESYQQAARYQGALVLDQRLQMGFISEATAMNVILPAGVPFLGGSTLFDLLPGGGSCSPDDDRDIGPDGLTSGWWFYFNSESDLIELH